MPVSRGLARTLLDNPSGDCDAFFTRLEGYLSLTASMIGRVLRVRRPASGSRFVAVTLALSLSLTALGPCLCEPDLARTKAAHACCASTTQRGAGSARAGTLIQPAAIKCCSSHPIVPVAEPVVERQVLQPAPVGLAVTSPASDRVLACSTHAIRATSPPVFSSPPPPVLRV